MIDWPRIKAIGAGITVGASMVPWSTGKTDFEQRELQKMRERVEELQRLLGMRDQPSNQGEEA